MKVRELMTKQPTTVEPDATLGEVATLMKQEDCGSIPVVEGNRLVGIVTDRDIVIRGVAAGKDPKTLRVSEVMSSTRFDRPRAAVDDASKGMADRQIRRYRSSRRVRSSGSSSPRRSRGERITKRWARR